jgi:hypothetical protein
LCSPKKKIDPHVLPLANAILTRVLQDLEFLRTCASAMPKGAAGSGAAAFAAGHVNGVTSDRATLLRSRSSLELSRELARGLGKGSGHILRSAAKLPAAAVADVAAAVAAGRRKHEQSFERCPVALPPKNKCTCIFCFD